MAELDLHAEAEQWLDNREEVTCATCGGPRVVFIPVWASGEGILTPEEIGELLEKERLNVIELAQADIARGFEPFNGALSDDVVLHIDGYRNGTFRAVIIARGGADGQAYTRYGRGSIYGGARGWRHGLASSTHTVTDTTPQEEADGLIAYVGERGVLNFTLLNQEKSLSPEAKAARKERRALRDRTSKDTAWQRHKAAVPRPPGADPEGGEAEGAS